MIITLIRLQLSLLRGGVRGKGPGILVVLLVYGLSLAAAGGILAGAFALRRYQDVIAPSTVVLSGLLTVGWILLPALFGNGASSLDPSRLALFPLRRRTVAVGLVAAAAVTPGGLLVGAVVISAVVVTNSVASALVGLIAGVVLGATCLTLGRVSAAAMSGLFRGRKTREAAGVVAALLAMGVGLGGQVLTWLVQFVDREVVEDVAAVVRWTPFAVTGRAIGAAVEGRWLDAVISLAVAVGILAGLVALWAGVLERLLSSTAAASSGEVDTTTLMPRWVDWLPNRPSSVVAGRELRSMRRDPRQWRQIAGFAPLAVIFALPVAAIGDNEPRVPLLVAILGITMGFLTFNLFGADGRSASGDLLVVDTVRTIFNGKHLAWALVLVPLAVIVVVGLSIYTGSWLYLIPAAMLTGALFMVSSAVGAVTSAMAPMTLPEGMGWGGADVGQGCLVGLISVLGLGAAMLLALVPVGLVVGGSYLATWTMYPAAVFAVVYAVGLRHLGVTIGVARIDNHRPEFLAKFN